MLTAHDAQSQVMNSMTVLIACILIITSRPTETGDSEDRKEVHEGVLGGNCPRSITRAGEKKLEP